MPKVRVWECGICGRRFRTKKEINKHLVGSFGNLKRHLKDIKKVI